MRGPSAVSGLEDGNVRQISILLRVVETIANDKTILDGEADVFDLDVDLAARWFAEQARRPEGAWIACAENLLQVGEGEAGIDDVLDDDDIFPVERCIEI